MREGSRHAVMMPPVKALVVLALLSSLPGGPPRPALAASPPLGTSDPAKLRSFAAHTAQALRSAADELDSALPDLAAATAAVAEREDPDRVLSLAQQSSRTVQITARLAHHAARLDEIVRALPPGSEPQP
jgi:ABC-type transporter Mla subunit MlaD